MDTTTITHAFTLMGMIVQGLMLAIGLGIAGLLVRAAYNMWCHSYETKRANIMRAAQRAALTKDLNARLHL